jgi:hypothetical protein
MKKYNIDLGPDLNFEVATKAAKSAGFGGLAGLIRFLLINWMKENAPQALSKPTA